MPDNITAKANTGLGTEILAADDVGGVFFARSKIALGADGAFDGDVSSANPLPTLPASSTSSFINSVATTNGTVIKASAGTLYSLVMTNNNAAARFVRIYNSASVTVGTTTVAQCFALPATSGVVTVDFGALGLRCSTGICLSITGAAGDADTTAVTAGDTKVSATFI